MGITASLENFSHSIKLCSGDAIVHDFRRLMADARNSLVSAFNIRKNSRALHGEKKVMCHIDMAFMENNIELLT